MDYRERWELKEYLLGQRLARRVTLVHAGILVLILAYVLGFWNLQGVHGGEYKRLAETNRLRNVPLLPMRGVIYDRRNEVIASTRPSLRLTLRREGLRDSEEQLRRLEAVLSVPYENLMERLEQVSGRPIFEPVVLMDDMVLSQLAPIEARREWFPSLEVQQTARRTYPAGKTMAHVLGYVGEVSEEQLATRPSPDPLQRGDIVGKSGVERFYDRQLRGQRGWKFLTVNSMGRQIGEGRPGRMPQRGQDLRLTLDLRLQRALVEALGDEAGSGIFMDPRTGEVLALASTPSFDPNLFSGGIKPEAWKEILHDQRQPLHHRAIASFYAPGSIFKVVVAVAALETGAVTPSTLFNCKGFVNMYGRNLLCWKQGGHGQVNLHEALVHSCNVYFYYLGKELGLGPIHRYGSLFSLGRLTGIDLPGEAAGVLPSEEWKRRVQGEPWYPGETISVAIGQGLLAVTPLQLACMISAVGTGGKLPRPRVVQGQETEAVEIDVSPYTLAIVQKALKEAVRVGTGRRASLRSIAVAGKTGTAQVFNRSAGVDPDKLPRELRDHAWFVGYAPADHPEIAFAVAVEHGGKGGQVAAPVARRVLEVYFADRLPRQKGAPALRAGTARSQGVPRVGTASSR